MIDEHTLKTLEYPKIIALIDGRCRTPYGHETVAEIQPLFDKETIERKLTEVCEMLDIISFGLAFPLYRMEDCRDSLARSQVSGMFLEPSEMLHVLELIEVSVGLHGYDREGREKFSAIDVYLKQIRAFPELRTEIRRIIDENGEVRDNASPKLKQIRLELADSKRKILARLERVLSDQQKQPGWQDDVITQRSGRYVICIPTSQFRSGSGILHDRSQSGATLYVEPEQAVELNNKINMLFQDERLELDRILRALTAEIATRADALKENTRLIGILDALYSCASFSREIGGTKPQLQDQSMFDLRDVRHPLLMVQLKDREKVVPTSLRLDDDRRAIIITGPNTGGKTVTLKTIGLSILMVQSGLPIAADHRSAVGLFTNLFADIGDEQSIEQSLSTFSSHMTNIVRALKKASKSALLLFDEIGAGTDPKEGGALAEAIILYAVEKQAKLIATTHYSHLKTLATEYPEIENAALEFDRKSLAPTFRLHLGIPGGSFAVEIAGRLGLPEDICRRAARTVGQEEKSLDELIASVEKELAQVKKDSADLQERLDAVKRREQEYEERLAKLNSDTADEHRQTLETAKQFLDETRKEIEKLVAEIRLTKADKQAVKEFHHRLQHRQHQLESMQPAASENTAPYSFAKGDAVEIITLQQRGEIDKLLTNERARVRVGSVQTTVDLRHLRKIDAGVPASKKKVQSLAEVEQAERPEIHLRGMTVEEATEALERFLDRAVLAGFHQVYIVHGKGTGTLRRTLTQYLKNHPDVESLRLGDWNEGGVGVTIAKLKQ